MQKTYNAREAAEAIGRSRGTITKRLSQNTGRCPRL